MDDDESPKALPAFLSEPPLELAEKLLENGSDFKSLTNLLCVNKHWALTVATKDSSWQYLAAACAKSALLVAPVKAHSTWREEARSLFELRGTFGETFCGAPAPPPPVSSFTVAVGCRFRPPGGDSDESSSRETVLPLYQRLRLIMQAHGCDASEARRRLWSRGEATSGAPDPWSQASCPQQEPPAPTEAEEAIVDPKASSPAAPPAEAQSDKDGDKENSPSENDKAVAEGCNKDAAADCPAEGGGSEEATTGGGGGGLQLGLQSGLLALQGGRAIFCAPGAGIRAFQFANAWGETSSQADVFEKSVGPLVQSLFNGKSACVLAYGQTGAGKTFTMAGSDSEARNGVPLIAADGTYRVHEQAGLVPRALAAILSGLPNRTTASGGVTCELKCAALEVFGDSVTDLLHGGTPLGAWAGVASAAAVAGHADEVVCSVGDALELLERADGAKRKAATLMNERSSRAHSLLMLTLTQRSRTAGGSAPETLVTSRLCLADLGGCEKVKRSGATGERLAEAININKGLLALKSVITALHQKRNYVPYQDDKLTTLLRPSLAGGVQTYVLIAGRPEAEHAAETADALRFGESCAQVEVSADGHVAADRAAAAALDALDAEIATTRQKILEKERFETVVVRRRDERAGALIPGTNERYKTDTEFEEVKVSRIVGAEKEHEVLNRLLDARRKLVGE